jgi:hypothetical protein
VRRRIVDDLVVWGVVVVASFGLLAALFLGTFYEQDDPIMDRPAAAAMMSVAVTALVLAIAGARSTGTRRVWLATGSVVLSATWFLVFPTAGVGLD